jgi:hypothetical protein
VSSAPLNAGVSWTNMIGNDMLKKDDSTWRFVAMEYHAVIPNRTFAVTVTSTQVCGARVRGLPTSPSQSEPEYGDPELHQAVRLLDGVDIASDAYYRLEESDFQISFTELERVRFDASRKRGLESVHYSGRLYLDMRSGVSREFVLVGTQDGKAIFDRLAESIRRARAS